MRGQEFRTLGKVNMALELGICVTFPVSSCGSFTASDSLPAPYCHHVAPGQMPGHSCFLFPRKWVKGYQEGGSPTLNLPPAPPYSRRSQFYFSLHTIVIAYRKQRCPEISWLLRSLIGQFQPHFWLLDPGVSCFGRGWGYIAS